MRLLLAMSWRNLWRQRRRTIISLSAAGFGLALVIFYGGMMEGMIGEAKNQLDNTGMGHVEIYPEGWRPRRPAEVALENPKALIEGLGLPAGSEAGARIVTRGLATAAHGAQGVTVFGVDPADEVLLSAHFGDITQGEGLAADDARGILVGEKLAEALKLKVGSKLKLMAQGADGEMAANLFRVRGFFHSISSPLSRATVYVTAPAARGLLGLSDAAHQLVIQLPDAAQAEAVAASARERLGASAEVVTYGDLMPALMEMEEMMNTIMTMMTLFVYLLVGMGILNTMLMSVMERTREFGVMRALGERRGGVVKLVLAESFWIALLSVAIGTSVGVLIVWWASSGEVLDWGGGVGESIDYAGTVIGTKVATKLSLPLILTASGLVFFLTLLVGLIPARRVAKMEPAKALRTN